MNSPTRVVGVSGGALQFDESQQDRVQVNTNFGLTNSATMSMWVNLATDSEGGAFIKIGGQSFGPALGVGNSNFGNNGDDLIMLSEKVAWMDTNVAIGSGSFHHVAMTMTPSGASDAIFQAYLDGAAVGSPFTNAVSAGDAITEIGGYIAMAGDRFSDVTIDDVQIYDEPLSATDIQYLFNTPGTAIPEPSAFALVSLAGLLGITWRRRKKRFAA